MGSLEEVIGATATLVLIIWGGQNWVFKEVRSELDDSRARQRWAAKLRAGQFLPGLPGEHYGVQEYRAALSRALVWIDQQLGPVWHPKGFLFSLGLAHVYSPLFYMAPWTFGYAPEVGGLALLPPDWSPWQRFLLLMTGPCAMLAGTGLTRFAAKAGPRVRSYAGTVIGMAGALSIIVAANMAPGELARAVAGSGTAVCAVLLLGLGLVVGAAGLSGFVEMAITSSIGIGIVVVVGVGVVYVAGVALAVPDLVAGALGAVAAIAGIASRVISIRGAVGLATFAGAVVGLVVAMLDFEPGYLLIFWLLPFINALMDWPSWIISRVLIRHLADSSSDAGPGPTVRSVAIHTMLDFLAALTLLVLLAAVLPAAVTIMGAHAPQPFPIQRLVLQAAADPWGNGLWITLMLMSTLLPTAAHATVLLGSTAVCQFPLSVRRHYWKMLDLGHPDAGQLNAAALFLVWRFGLALFVGTLTLLVLALATAWASYPVGTLLKDIALGSCRWAAAWI